jgi:hypothetical protein
MTYSLQELEALCAAATPGPWEVLRNTDGRHLVGADGHGLVLMDVEPEHPDLQFMAAARTAIPELIARIKELDPDYHAAPAQDAVARAQALMREAAERRARLEKALAEAKMGDVRELNAMGLEAFLGDDGQVKIRQKPRATK